MTDTKQDQAFEEMATAFKRQFRLELVLDSTDENGVIHVTDNQGQGDVKYLGTLRSNWLRRHSQNFGFTSIGHELLPEVAGGAYRYQEFSGMTAGEAIIDEIQQLEDDPEAHVVTTAKLHSVGIVPEESAVQGTHIEIDPAVDDVMRTPPSTFRERFLDN